MEGGRGGCRNWRTLRRSDRPDLVNIAETVPNNKWKACGRLL